MSTADLNETNAYLESLMPEALKDQAKNHDFFALLFQSSVLILGGTGNEGAAALNEGSQVRIEQWTAADGMVFIPVFTTPAEMLRTVENKDSNFLVLGAGDLLRMVQGTDVVINPASPHAFHIDADTMEALIAHFTDHDHAHASDELPVRLDGLKEALASLCVHHEGIAFAAIALASYGNGDQAVAAGFRQDGGLDIGTLEEKIRDVCAPHMPEGFALDIIALPELPEDGSIEAYLLHEGDRFYTR